MVEPRQPNKSVADSFRCLQLVTEYNRPVGVSEISERSGIELTRTHRLLRTLASTGMLTHTDKRKYAVGPALPILATQALRASHLTQSTLIPMERLRKKHKEHIVALGIRWEKSVSFLYHAKARTRLEQAIVNHDVWPASLSGIGVVLLSLLSSETLDMLYADDKVIDGHSSMDALRKELALTRERGYSKFNTQVDWITIAKPIPSLDYAAVGVSIKNPTEEDEKQIVGDIDSCIQEIDELLRNARNLKLSGSKR